MIKIVGLVVLAALLLVACVLYAKTRLEKPEAPAEPQAPVPADPVPVEEPKKTLLSNTELDGEL